MVVHGDGQYLFSLVLTDDVFIELVLDFRGFFKGNGLDVADFKLLYHIATDSHALVANTRSVLSADKTVYFFFRFSAKRTKSFFFQFKLQIIINALQILCR